MQTLHKRSTDVTGTAGDEDDFDPIPEALKGRVDEALWRAELALEEEMTGLGVKRAMDTMAKARERGYESQTKPGQRLIDHAFWTLLKAIETWLKEAGQGKAGNANRAVKRLRNIDPAVQAYVALRTLMDTITDPKLSLSQAAYAIGKTLRDEEHFRAFEEQNKLRYNLAQKRLASSPAIRFKASEMRKTALFFDVKAPDWGSDMAHVGIKLVELVAESTGLVRIVRGEGRHSRYMVQATEKTLEWLDKAHHATGLATPLYMPTLVPPAPWKGTRGGGYWSSKVAPRRFLRTWDHTYEKALNEIEMPEVYEAVNALQETPWRINSQVLAVMEEVWRLGDSSGLIPALSDGPRPERPFGIPKDVPFKELPEEQQAALRAYQADRLAHDDMVVRNRSKRVSFAKMMSVARRLVDADAIYFPHCIDFRGRVYPMPLFLHPQSHDAARGLLEFANAVPIHDEEAAGWLARHGAALWGVDKVSTTERIAWVEQHTAEIIASAEEPFENRFWREAESPWQALAFCQEWKGFKEEGYGYLSGLPVQMDGSCNGLQHFSAMLRDPQGGSAVNLVPADKPQDIYQEVADVVNEILEREAVKGEENAVHWLGKVTRSVVKRPVMTLGYGATRRGFIDQILNDTVLPMRQEMGKDFPWKNDWTAARYLAEIVWGSVGEVVRGAREVMDWLQEVAHILNSENKPVRWTAPSGFVVSQFYRKMKTKKLRMTLFQKTFQTNWQVEEGEEGGFRVDKIAQRNGIAPNFVHSLDAAHLKRTVLECKRLGINSFSMIHDSYGTHAGNAGVMARVLREEYAAMYEEHDPLEEFWREVQTQTDQEVPPPPAKGSLDIRQVLDSEYFFA